VRRILLRFLAAVALTAFSTASAGATILEVIEVPSSFGVANGSVDFTQTFTPTVSGVITTVGVGVSFPRPDIGPGALRIYDGIYNGISGGTLIYNQPVTWNPGSNYVQTVVLGTPLPVIAGNTYTFKPLNTQYWMACCSTDRYAGGEVYINGSSYFAQFGNVTDFVFKIVIETESVVPVENVTWGRIKAQFGHTAE